jgi:hypothetical protein
MVIQKEIVINHKINNVIKQHFSDNITTLSLSKVEKLYSEGSISNSIYKFLKDVVKYQKREVRGDIEIRYQYKLSDKPQIKMTQELDGMITTYFKRDIKHIRIPLLKQLVADKKITKEQEKIFIALKRAFLKGTLDDIVDYSEFTPVDDAAKDDNKTSDEEGSEYSPDSPKLDEEGNVIAYDDSDKPGKYKTSGKETSEYPPDKGKIDTYVSSNRKAFVDYVNTDFYKDILRQTSDPLRNDSKLRYGQDTPSSLNAYQILVREYLSIETPYRGLLVYHGLGTGKTATAVAMAEKASSDMNITTMLPASLESNFIGEVKQWGKDELDMEGSHWTFVGIHEIEGNDKLRKDLYKRYKVTNEVLKQIMNHTIREVKKSIKSKLVDADPELQNKKPVLFNKLKIEYKKVSTKVAGLKGFWTHGDKGTRYKDMDPLQQTFLECQIHKLVVLKYNFIHYNPLPTVTDSDMVHVEGDSDDELFNDDVDVTGNALIKEKLLQQMNMNISQHGVESPFYEETLIIDEVHNFVREVVNDSGSARTFYEWIVNAERVKLVFLSGTPIINKPSEIAVLYNMLKGKQHIYTVIITSKIDPSQVVEQLNDIYYKTNTPIELFHVSRKEGKLLISYTMNQETFVSVMNRSNKHIYTSSDNKHTYEDFMKAMYDGLSKVFDIEDITPTIQQALSSKQKSIRFDSNMNIPFYQSQKLFEIKDQGELRDLSEDENFMDYFFLDNLTMDDQKQTLLRRMLMGMTSYYPIDRSQIGSMPTVAPPQVTGPYQYYSIAKKITVEACTMSQRQFNKYIEVWRSEKKRELLRRMKRNLHEDIPFDFNIRTRQICNMIYDDDDFRYSKNGDRVRELKLEQYELLKQAKSLEYDQQLAEYSPKLHRIMKNIQRYRDGFKPTGKVLIYSGFRGDSGGEIVEQVLKANGYSLYNPLDQPSASLKFTFITGEEGVDERKANMKAFNAPENKLGAHIQVMIISGAGAEGISLTCVRQVHIFEPYWNFVRIDQVFGRAIRLHSHDELDPKDRNVEEYLYLSTLPQGPSIEEIYQSIQEWDNIPTLRDIKTELTEVKHKGLKELIDMIHNIGASVDERIFDIMHKKYQVSRNIIDIIKESSLDCIQHTRDDPAVHEKCVRFSQLLASEIAYFPGISADELFEIDIKQLKASFMLFMKPNTYVVGVGDNRYVYYESDKDKVDIRYIREHAKKICSLSLDEGNIYVQVDEDHDVNEELGKHFSVYQDMYSLEKYADDIDEQKFPSIKSILSNERIGYKIKYNPNEMMFFSPHETNTLRRLYRFDEYVDKKMVKPLLLCPGASGVEVFIQD